MITSHGKYTCITQQKQKQNKNKYSRERERVEKNLGNVIALY